MKSKEKTYRTELRAICVKAIENDDVTNLIFEISEVTAALIGISTHPLAVLQAYEELLRSHVEPIVIKFKHDNT